MYHVVSTIINDHKVNDAINNELKFDISNSIDNTPINYTLPIVTVSLRGGKNSRQTLKSGLI